MVNSGSEWPSELRALPSHLEAEAAANPGGAVAEIDGSMIPDPNGYVPGEAIIGVYEVGPDGRATGRYLRNPNYGPVRDDWRELEQPDHWLGWLPGAPSAAVREQILAMLVEQKPGSVLEWVKVLQPPEFLTGGLPVPDSPQQLTVTRAGLALEFALSVVPPSGRREFLLGVFTWVATNLNQPGSRRDRTWLDLGVRLDVAKESLAARLYGRG